MTHSHHTETTQQRRRRAFLGDYFDNWTTQYHPAPRPAPCTNTPFSTLTTPEWWRVEAACTRGSAHPSAHFRCCRFWRGREVPNALAQQPRMCMEWFVRTTRDHSAKSSSLAFKISRRFMCRKFFFRHEATSATRAVGQRGGGNGAPPTAEAFVS